MIEGNEGSRGPVTRFFPVHPTGVVVSERLNDGDRVRVGDTEFEVFAGTFPHSRALVPVRSLQQF